MEKALCEARLWQDGEGSFNVENIQVAWQVMARLGRPYRFSGRGPQGGYECQVYDLHSGCCIALGEGLSCAEAMCQAALQAVKADGSAGVGEHGQIEG